MMSLKERTIEKIINLEGGYTNDPSDSGGETNFGITSVVARENGYNGSIELMPRRVAFNIYAREYWDAVKADDIAELSQDICKEIVDTGVNTGVSRAATFLQRALNVFNNRGKIYTDIAVDGKIGPATISSLKSYLKKRDEQVLLKMLNCLQGCFYMSLAERREKDEKFIYGWLKQRV